MASGNEYAPVFHGNGKSLVVGVYGRQRVPLPVFQVLCRLGGDEAVGMATDNHRLSIYIKGVVAKAGYVKVGQPHYINLDTWTFLHGCSMTR